MPGEHAGHRQRMRQRFAQEGLDGFAAHEVLELILTYAIPQKNVNPLAHRLINAFGSLHAVLEADVQELVRVEGIGEYAATLISLFSHTARRLQKSRSEERKLLRNREVCCDHCRSLLSGLRQEHLYLVCMNAQMEVLHNALIAKGTLSEVPAYPRLVAEAAIRANAHAAVLCHNHPGGSAIPSMQDLEMTAALSRGLHALDILLVDHVIVSGDEALSLVECGLMQHDRTVSGVAAARVANSGSEVLIRQRVEELRKKKGIK